jgi:hypothetical protein
MAVNLETRHAQAVVDLAMFLLETPERPFNVGPLVLLRPPKGARRFADRLHERMLAHEPGPPFNYRLQLSLTRLPSVEPMAGADLSKHVHRLTLTGAGSMDELMAKVCELHESPLSRDGLLWQFYVIDGLADGRVALYSKVHHGIISEVRGSPTCRPTAMPIVAWFSTAHDAFGLRLSDASDRCRPAAADAVDPVQRLSQREDAGGLQAQRDARIQPGGHGIACARRLRHQRLEPAQRVELLGDQPRAARPLLASLSVFGLERFHLFSLREVFDATRRGEPVERRNLGSRLGQAADERQLKSLDRQSL